jgi:hypothetical protein
VRHPHKLLIALVVFVALGSGCGGSGGSDTPAPAAGSRESTAPPAVEESPPAEDGMPDLTGMTIDEASDTLEAVLNSYNLKIAYESSDAPAGTVFEQRPAAGSPLEAGRLYTVRVTVSE